MDDSQFEIGNKAEKLYFAVFDVTTNHQHYPVRFQRLSDKLQEYALDIYGNLIDANSFKTDTPQHRAAKSARKAGVTVKIYP